MKSTNTDIFFITLAAALVASIIGFITKKFYEKYFALIPKINITITGKETGGHGNYDIKTIKANWNVTINFANNSNYNAINLSIQYLNASNFKGSFSAPRYFGQNTVLRGFETIDRYVGYEKLIDKSLVKDRGRILSDFMPDEIKNLSFLLTFENEKRKKIYIEFKNDKAKTYLRRRKRFKKYLDKT